MASGCYRFGSFSLDAQNRRLLREGAPVELNSRYLDALALLVRERGKLVSKERFLEEVWRGVPVTDEALTQCIKTLRKMLGDDAASPLFIETVPKHGYRFVAAVSEADTAPEANVQPGFAWRRFLLIGGAGMLGGAAAGMIGGLLYSLVGAAQPLGAASALLVLVCITTLVGLTGGAGVGFGIAAADAVSRRRAHWSIVGGAVGGLLVGAFVKLLGLDAFNLLFGQSPGNITGGAEGALLGAAVGVGAWLASRGAGAFRRSVSAAGLAGAAAGIVIGLSGGRLMAGSLDLLARRFPDSRLQIDQIGALFGESGFGPVSQIVTNSFEGALFGVCVVSALILVERRLRERA